MFISVKPLFFHYTIRSNNEALWYSGSGEYGLSVGKALEEKLRAELASARNSSVLKKLSQKQEH